MKRIFLAILLLAGCKEEKLNRVAETRCGYPCFTGTPRYIDVGVCHQGVWKCDESGEVLYCSGQKLPSPEGCDGLDNDCDGTVDNNLIVTKSCRTPCSDAPMICENGTLVCPPISLGNEVCDGLDNDCDGYIDEVEDLATQFCYTGPPNTIGRGSCHPGFTQCVNGKIACKNQQLPEAEACDGKDNDCNGKVDDLTQDDYDIVFAIDDSCSMYTTITKVKAAVSSFATDYGSSSNFKFALVKMTDPLDDGRVKLLSNFSDAVVFDYELSKINGDTGGMDEANLDVPYLVGDLFYNPLHLNWKPNSKKILIEFTDEEAQTYMSPSVTEYMAANMVMTYKVKTYIFNHQMYWLGFDEIAQLSGGQMMDISATPALILSDLQGILQGVCKP